MVVVLGVIAASVMILPIILVVLLSVAIKREDSARTLARPAQGPVRAAARQIAGFHAEGIEWLQPRSPLNLK
jgi:hypothetical protein